MNQLSLTLFGSFSAAISSQNLRLPTDKTRALLAYLALTAGTPLRREMLAGLLWPEQPEDLARQNLRQTAARLKRAIHDRDTQLANNLLTMTRQTIELHADYCAADALTYGQHLQAVQKHSHERLEQCPACLGRLQTAVQLYRQGDLLAGFSLPDAAPFEEWLVIQRFKDGIKQCFDIAEINSPAHLAVQWRRQHQSDRIGIAMDGNPGVAGRRALKLNGAIDCCVFPDPILFTVKN